MGYSVEINGVFVGCDTVEDIRNLLGIENSNGSKPKRRNASARRSPKELSRGLETEVWNFLCENDSEEGVSVNEIEDFIESLGRARSSHSSTLSSLRNKDHAVKLLSNGNWRACTP